MAVFQERRYGWAFVSKLWIIILGGNSDLAIGTLSLLLEQKEFHFFVHHRRPSEILNRQQFRLGERMVLHEADLGDESAVIEMTSRMLRTCDSPRVLLQFAAPPLELRRFQKSSTWSFQSQFSVQTLASAIVLRSLLPRMKDVQSDFPAQVIFLLSEVVIGRPPKGMAEYVVGKYAMLGLMRALAAEFESSTLRFHAIAPGMMETKFLKNVPKIVIETLRTRRESGLDSVDSISKKLVILIKNPDGLLKDAVYLR